MKATLLVYAEKRVFKTFILNQVLCRYEDVLFHIVDCDVSCCFPCRGGGGWGVGCALWLCLSWDRILGIYISILSNGNHFIVKLDPRD